MIPLFRFKISGHSMEPTLHQGQTVLASSIPYLFSKPKIGDIVLIRHSGKRSAPRISSRNLQGVRRFWIFDSPRWSFGEAGQNDEEDKFFIKRISKIDPSADGDKYFVSGDNKNDSLDSREFGWIGKKDILGKLIYF